MRTNKKKLAALAMSAVMAASTMSFPVFADEFSDVPEVGEAVVGNFNEADVYGAAIQDEIDSVEIDDDGKVTVTYKSGLVDETTYKATLVKKEAATCTTKEKRYYMVMIDGVKWSETREVGSTLSSTGKHDPATKKELGVTQAPDCKNGGLGYYYYTCKVCGAEVDAQGDDVDKTQTVPIPATGEHTYGDPVVTYELPATGSNLDPEAAEDGILELLDPTEDGHYTLVTTKTCKVCGDSDVKREEDQVFKATDMAVASVTCLVPQANENSNIAADQEDKINGKKLSEIDDSEIKLVDCAKEGFYWVVSYSNGGSTISKVKHTVSAHHVEAHEFVAKDVDKDGGLLTPVYDEDDQTKQIGVKNQSCVKSIEYYERVYCEAEGHKQLSETLKVAEPEGPHILDAEGKAAVKAATENKEIVTKEEYLALKDKADDYGLKLIVADCCEDVGTVTIKSYCTVCGEEADSVTTKVAKLGHDYGDEVIENMVEATCSEEGSYDIVKYCKVCNDRKEERVGVVVPTLDHSFVDAKGNVDESKAYVKFDGNVVVDNNGYHLSSGKIYAPIQCFQGMNVTAAAVIDCAICGKAVVYDDQKNVTLTVKDIAKEDGNGMAGHITLQASFTKTVDNKNVKVVDEYTVPYFSNFAAYLDRNDKNRDGLTLDADGVFRYYADGIFQKDYTGFVEYNNEQFYVEDGVLSSKSGLKLHGDTFYYLNAGQLIDNFTGITMYNGEFFYVENGKLDTTKNGLIDYNGETFVIAAGRILSDLNGAWMNTDGTWYFIALGRVAKEYSGTTVYGGETFNVENGKLVF